MLYSSSVLLKPLPQVLNLVSHAAFGRSPGSCVLLHAASVVPQRGHVRSKQRAANTPERKDAEMKSSVAVTLKGHPGCVCGGRGVGGDRGGTWWRSSLHWWAGSRPHFWIQPWTRLCLRGHEPPWMAPAKSHPNTMTCSTRSFRVTPFYCIYSVVEQ